MQSRYFKSDHLRSSEQPKYVYEYYVTGRGPFPYDMLRYDSCWPVESTDAAAIGEASYGNGGQVSIRLRSYREPTVGRWASFVWSVGREKL